MLRKITSSYTTLLVIVTVMLIAVFFQPLSMLFHNTSGTILQVVSLEGEVNVYSDDILLGTVSGNGTVGDFQISSGLHTIRFERKIDQPFLAIEKNLIFREGIVTAVGVEVGPNPQSSQYWSIEPNLSSNGKISIVSEDSNVNLKVKDVNGNIQIDKTFDKEIVLDFNQVGGSLLEFTSDNHLPLAIPVKLLDDRVNSFSVYFNLFDIPVDME